MDKINIKVSGSLTGLKLKLIRYRSVYIVYDRNVAQIALKMGNYPSVSITADESLKTMESALKLCKWLLDNKADRNSIVLAVGGGFTSDLVGFAASIYRRGIRYANVPTTLLSQVDAGIGGKTGVNFEGFKNMLGVIRQPEFTYICPKFLETLPPREMNSGAAEMLKTFIIKDNGNYEEAVRVLGGERLVSELQPLIKAAAKVKASIVKKDPDERKGKRFVLNLGHTYAHAIESFQFSHAVSAPYTHGEAVAVGIIMAARKSEEKGYAYQGLSDKLLSDFEKVGLPTRLPCLEEDLEEAIRNDKKSVSGHVNFVYIERIGKVKVR